MTVEPGRQLAGRYRVEDLLSDRAGARSWRAVDEVLRRSVAIDVLPSHAERASALVQAARRSAVVTDGRFLRVLDASEENGDVYVVREWARGESLDLVLADGPLTHRRAAWVVREVAEAVGIAHHAGIYHLRLTPENVLVTDTGGVKIVGLATDAALHGLRYADAEAEDVRGLGRLLYASLVARWPEGPESGLPAAPVENGRLLLPRQVRAGVPRPVDEVCDRILGDPPRHQAARLRHANAVAAELNGTVRLATDAPPHHDPDQTQAAGIGAVGAGYGPTPTLPQRDPGAQTRVGGTRPGRAEDTSAWAAPRGSSGSAGSPGSFGSSDSPDSTRQIRASDVTGAAPVRNTAAPTHGPTHAAPVPPPPMPPAGRGSRPARAWMWVALAAVVVVLAAAAFLLGLGAGGNDGPDQAAPQPSPTTEPASNPLRPVGISSATPFDPFGEAGENNEAAALVLDGEPATEWTTLSYQGNPEFGGLKPGLGLILDLGEVAEVSRVTLGVRGSGTDLEVRAAPEAATVQPPAQLDAYTTVGSADGATGRTPVRVEQDVSTRYLLVWLTELPPESGSTYRGRISEITVDG